MGCLSGLSLALFDAGDLDASHSAALGSHAHPCPRCSRLLRELAAARIELFAGDPPTASLMASRQIAARVVDNLAAR